MGFLVQYALASLLLSVVLVFIYDHTVGQAVNRTVRVGVFVGAWAVITTILGVRGFSKAVSALRQKTKGVDNEISPVPKHRA